MFEIRPLNVSSDENYSGYIEQYDRAYKILIDYTSGLKKEQRVYW